MSMALATEGTEGLRVASGARGLIRRRPTLEQGRALEMLGHAVEYLVDSGLYRGESDELAVQVLMRANREVFAECAVVVPMGTRVRSWLGW